MKEQYPNKHEHYLIEVLDHRRFLPATELVRLLQAHFNVNVPNARKILERAAKAGFIKTSKPFTFGKGQYVYFSLEEVPNKQNIKAISREYRPPLFRLLQAIDSSGGILSYYEALKITASPDSKTSSKVSMLNELLEIIIDLKIAYIKEDIHGVRYILDKESVDEFPLSQQESETFLMSTHYSAMVMDCMFLPDILRWLRRVNLIATVTPSYRNKKTPSIGAVHNNLVWDAYTYTKTTGINPVVAKKADDVEKQTLVALDVVLSREYSQADLDGFLGRIQIYLNSVKTGVRKAMPIVVYQSASEQVLNTLSSLGFMSFNIGVIFGTHIYQLVERMRQVQIKTTLSKTEGLADEVAEVLTGLRNTGQEDNLNELKGILFESLLYPLLQNLYPNAEITHGRVLSKKEEGKKTAYEYDYIIRSAHPKEIILVELKGYSSAASIPLGNIETKNTLSWFFGRTMPFAKSFFQKELSEGYSWKACYITTASFFSDGRKFLDQINEGALKPTNMEGHYDGHALIEMLTARNFIKIRETLQKFYLNKKVINTEKDDVIANLL